MRLQQGISLRTAHAQDVPGLAVLANQVWLHTYATDGISTEIADYVLAELTPARFQALLQRPGAHVIVAAQSGHLLGYAVLQSDLPCPTAGAPANVELQTLYVQAHFLGQGIGYALLRAAEDWAQQNANSPLWLTVNAQNDNAIRFYQRQAYAQVGTSYFVLGSGRHENHVLVGAGTEVLYEARTNGHA